jgi:enoyl-CoA hydratase
MTYTEILFDPDAAGFVQITIHRPHKLNALSNRVMAELDDAFQSVEREYRGLILTGAGERAFVAGADIEELSGVSPLDGQARCARDQAIMRRLETMGKPSIAAINGYALGGGLELAMCCSLRVAASTAKMGLPEAKIGGLSANGGTQRLPRLVGRGRALEMMLTGAPIDAQEAWRIGLVNRVVEPAGLLAAAREMMLAILANSADSIACILRCVDTGLKSGLDAGLELEAANYAAISTGAEFRERLQAFLNRHRK